MAAQDSSQKVRKLEEVAASLDRIVERGPSGEPAQYLAAIDLTAANLDLINEMAREYGCHSAVQPFLDMVCNEAADPNGLEALRQMLRSSRVAVLLMELPDWPFLRYEVRRWATKIERPAPGGKGLPKAGGPRTGARVGHKQTKAVPGKATGTPGADIPDDATLSSRSLAKAFGLGPEAVRKRLERRRRRDRTCFIENNDRTQREALYLYRVGKVRAILEEMVEKLRRASGETSGERPAKKISP